MKDNLSIVITMIIFVILIVIFPLYNYFERQDDMSYNLVLKATTNFVDEVINTGYINQDMYDKYVSKLSNTGNLYDIQIEAHKKTYTKDPYNTESTYFIEQYEVDYSKDIFESNTGLANASDVIKNPSDKVLKNDIYYLNVGDQIYVKLSNSSTTMAGAIFNIIVPASSPKRISVNYGGVIKNNAWKNVEVNSVLQNGLIADLIIQGDGITPKIQELPTFKTGTEISVKIKLTNLKEELLKNSDQVTELLKSALTLSDAEQASIGSDVIASEVNLSPSGVGKPGEDWIATFRVENIDFKDTSKICQIKLKTEGLGESFYQEVFSNKIAITK